jgi:hypothetical protein
MLVPYLDALDLTCLPRALQSHRELIADMLVPTLLSRQADRGRDILVGHNIDLVSSFQAEHPEMPLFQPFDRRCQPSANERDTIVLIAKRDERQIGCVAARNLWIERDLGEELRTLRLFYEDVFDQATPGEICYVPVGIASGIRAVTVALGGAGYVEATERGDGLYSDMVKLLFILELASWRFSHQAALMANGNIGVIGLHPNGMRDFVAPVFRLVPGQNLRDRLYWLTTRERAALVADLLRPEMANEKARMNWPTEADLAAARYAIWGNAASGSTGRAPRDRVLRDTLDPSL